MQARRYPGCKYLQESARQHLFRGVHPSLPRTPSKMCRAKQLQARMHIDANIHSWEYNKPACQTLIFLSVQISTQL